MYKPERKYPFENRTWLQFLVPSFQTGGEAKFQTLAKKLGPCYTKSGDNMSMVRKSANKPTYDQPIIGKYVASNNTTPTPTPSFFL